MASKTTVEIDGSIMEGGGQILRNSIALSCLTQTDITIHNIRAKRSKPGLAPQHLMGLRLVRDICAGHLTGDGKGSTSVTFQPSHIKGDKYEADTKTAGSVCLLLQVSLPCLCFAPENSSIYLKGGTNASMAPPIDYFTMVLQPILAKMGIKFNCYTLKRGFYPKGGGEVRVEVDSVRDKLKPITMTDFGNVVDIHGYSFVAGALPPKVAHIMAKEAKRVLQPRFPGVNINIDSRKESEQTAVATGCGIIIVATTSTGCVLAGQALGERGKPAEKVGQEAGNALLEELNREACVDSHLQDQLILFMALADGKSVIKSGPLTLHTETAIHIAKTLTKAKFEIHKDSDSNDNVTIECDGIGYCR